MPTQKSPVLIALRSGISALGHAIYWFVCLNVAFSVGGVDFVDAEFGDRAPLLVAGLWVTAGIVILSAITLASCRLLAAKGSAAPTLVAALTKATVSAAYWFGALVWLGSPLFAWLFGDIVNAQGEIVAGPSPFIGQALMLALLAGWAVISALWDRKA